VALYEATRALAEATNAGAARGERV